MRTIAITINKGGVGKTFLTKSLATAATEAGLNVVMFDMDTQQNTENWTRRRAKQQGKKLPLARCVTEDALPDELAKSARAGCDLAFIDTPPGRSTEALAAVEAADLVLIPFWNDQDAYDGVKRTTSFMLRLGKTGYGVLNCAPPNSRSHEEAARVVLATMNLPLAPVVLHRYDAHRLASVKGLTAQESEPASVAAAEIAALWAWLAAILQTGTPAPVHNAEATA